MNAGEAARLMIDLDPSVVVALLTLEGGSPYALEWFEQCRETLISSDWLITETHSALGIKQRHHDLSPQIRQAAELLQDPALDLRAGDALHLAVALHRRCTHLASFDGRMLQAATKVGVRPAQEPGLGC